MTDFLNSLKADLLDRRLLPILGLVGALLLAALIYAVAGGGSAARAPEGSATTAGQPAGISVRESRASSAQAVAETTSGSPVQRRGIAHDPFNPLPGAGTPASSAAPTTSAPTSGSSSSGASGSSGTTETGGSSKGEAAPSPSKSTTPAKPKTVYEVSVLFGVLPPGTPPAAAQLTPHTNLKQMQAFPSAKQPLVVFRGVTGGGKSASFTIVGEVILQGNVPCLPSPTQCQEINLKPGQTEQFEYLTSEGQVVTYELRIVSIVARQDSAKASSARAHFSMAGREVLESVGLLSVPGMRLSPTAGVLSFDTATSAAAG
jgi:hypothetical protein